MKFFPERFCSEKMEEKVSDKIKRHVPWEIFWQSIPIILIGIFLTLSGIFNFYNWIALIRLLSILGGLLLLILGLYVAKNSWEKM